MSRKVEVVLSDHSYDIVIDSGLLEEAACLSQWIKGQEVVLVCSDGLPERLMQAAENSLSRFKLLKIVFPDGEQNKNFDTLQFILTKMLEARISRKATLVALGGGVTGDMAGFAASIYQRGIPFIQVPTTLLAQVDSSVGGKTAVNHLLGKNMIGAFYQPQGVLIDIAVLKTLPQREVAAGLAEVIKYGFIYDEAFIGWLEKVVSSLSALDSEVLAEAIERSCQIKAEVVAIDERESGIRAILNLGHTFGHAIEAYTGYQSWLHGEAVGTGMLMAADLSHRLGMISEEDVFRVRGLVEGCKLPVSPPEGMLPEDFMRYMSLDKKVVEGRIRLVLLESLGKAVVTDDYDPGALQATLEAFCC